MPGSVAEVADIELAPLGREQVPVQLSRLLEALESILIASRELAARAGELGDSGTNDLLTSQVVRTNEKQVWFVAEHLVDTPLARAVE
jgi:starvation-inducible DNA-binding protein